MTPGISIVVIHRDSTLVELQKTLNSIVGKLRGVEQLYLISTSIQKGLLTQNKLIGFDFVHSNENNHDIGSAINQLIPLLTTEYVMFLYSQESLIEQLTDLIQYLGENQSVLSLSAEMQGLSYNRPFLVKTSRLHQGPLFYAADQVPFPEAVLPAWLAQINRSEVVDLPVKVIEQSQKHLRIKDRYMYDVLTFYKPRSTYSPEDRLQPSIAVVLSSYNMGGFLETALASLEIQNEQPDQILVIDDGSSDNTQERLKKWLKLSNLTTLQTQNVGKARALNKLLPYVKSDFVLELDADDWLDPNAISVIRKHLRDLPLESNLLYGNLRMWKQHISGRLLCRGVRFGKPISHADELLQIPLPLGPRVYRASALFDVGGFPVVNFAGGRLYEDVLVVRKIMERSPILYQDFTVYNVREHPTSITKRNLSKWREFQNKWHQHLSNLGND